MVEYTALLGVMLIAVVAIVAGLGHALDVRWDLIEDALKLP